MDSKRKVKYLTIFFREIDYEDNQKTDGGIAYIQILITVKLQIGMRGQKNRANWDKSIKEPKVRTRL